MRRCQRILALVWLLSVVLAQAGERPTAAPVPLGGVLRDASLDGLNGPARRLVSFRGQPLIINLWASWCGPCRAETASLERLAWQEDAGTFRIIGISTDDERAAAQAWLANSHATIPHFLDHNTELETMLGASHIPLTLLVAADGRVLERVYGAQEWDSPAQRAHIRRAFGAAASKAVR